ncbi:hypothetical protein NSMM_520029 [Nitrosomonas mobilis]|uniref:Terminase ATPase subunit N-terminal domain-containing protein n=1 Tax=Nitrosomonas mobilis TaxID=51642 RepID=A0A1G5SJ18_9PROT|nr:hypothetical protein NSMM_520029 [Nitrosomonas mobilis]
MYLLGSGWPVGRVAQALMIDRESVRNHHKRYRKGGLMALLRNEMGGNAPLSKSTVNFKKRNSRKTTFTSWMPHILTTIRWRH